MNKIVADKILQQYENLRSKQYEVLSIFNHFYGEHRVDMQDTLDYNSLLDDFRLVDFSRYTKDQNCDIFNTIFDEGNSPSERDIENFDKILTRLVADGTFKNIVNSRTPVSSILIHFPKVRVTNEHDRHIDIQDLYVKVRINLNGEMYDQFSMNRATYSYNQFHNNYMHSHIHRIPIDILENFQYPCLGTGPIRGTIRSLANTFNKDLWELFCVELDKFVKTESIVGTPYHYLEDVVSMEAPTADSLIFSSNIPLSCKLLELDIGDFVRHLIRSKKLRFRFTGKRFLMGMSEANTILTLSNEFIDWWNKVKYTNKNITLKTLLEHSILFSGYLKGGRIYHKENIQRGDLARYAECKGRTILSFKGNKVKLRIVEESLENNELYFLHENIVSLIITKILTIINSKYGRSERSEINKKTRYI